MRARIGDFLATKRLSANSRAAYTYDLEQFCQLVDSQPSPEKLLVYQQFLDGLAISASKRKQSAVNQFLYYLYQLGDLTNFYKLSPRLNQQVAQAPKGNLLELSQFWQETTYPQGQLIALLIWQLGLTPSEVLAIRTSDIDQSFQVLTVRKADLVRVLNLPNQLMPYLTSQPDQLYLFDKKGQAYSRQWAFRELNRYLASLGLSELTAQDLREQYILGQVVEGQTAWDLAKKLGLKTIVTLNKYYK